jgi:hypothetical protein
VCLGYQLACGTVSYLRGYQICKKRQQWIILFLEMWLKSLGQASRIINRITMQRDQESEEHLEKVYGLNGPEDVTSRLNSDC